MQWNLVWFVLAGFLLGFSASTLWEWIHFRRERMKVRDQRVEELEAKLREHERLTEEARREGNGVVPWPVPEYRSPDVFLETEEVGETFPIPVQKPVAEPVSLVREEQAPAEPAKAQLIPVATVPSPPEVPKVAVADAPAVTAPAPFITPGSVPRSTDYPDDLCKIKGIGDVYKRRLYAAGIYTWQQIADSDIDVLRVATKAYPSSNVDEWPPQARQLAEKFGRQTASYTGALPDDLAVVNGIGPVSAQVLCRVGICTFEQLASTTPRELAELFPIAVAGDRPDFESWIEQANQLAQAKQSH
jgi:predicted flap endonuclease-1-like 5' DNA nuclease